MRHLEHSKNTPEVFRELILNEQTISEKIKAFLKKEGNQERGRGEDQKSEIGALVASGAAEGG